MKIRVALFCSLFRGRAMLERIIQLQKRFPEIEVVGVATDDPKKSWSNAKNRLWQYVEEDIYENLVLDLATQNNIPVTTNRIKTTDFYDQFAKEWKPDICYMGVFGQKIPEEIWSYPLFGFLNFHTCGGIVWPSNAGGNPIKQILSEGRKSASIAMHQIDNQWDNGELLAFSPFFPVNESDNAVTVNESSAHLVADMLEWHLLGLMGKKAKNEPRFVNPLFGSKESPFLAIQTNAA